MAETTPEPKITIRMDRSSWDQIHSDLGDYWGMRPEDAEVFDSVEIVQEDPR
jgi:hypothetical protein